MTIGQRIAKLRALCGLKQGDLSSKIWQTVEVVNEWESDSKLPDIAGLSNLSKLFGVSLDFLLNGDQNTKGDIDAAHAIVQHDKFANLRKTNLEIVENCKKKLIEHGLFVDERANLDLQVSKSGELYLPKLSADCLTFVDYGIFDKNDFNCFDKAALFSHNLTNLVLQFFLDTISFVDAVKCDDTKVFEAAECNRLRLLQELEQKNVSATQEQKGYAHLISHKKLISFKEYRKRSKNIGELQKNDTFVEDKDWALEHLNYDLENIYSVVIYLINNGAEYFSVLEYSKISEIVVDVSKTKFVYRVAKDMLDKNKEMANILNQLTK